MEQRHVHYGTFSVDSCKCGRFLVRDDTGVAVVDDDAFDMWAADGASVRGSTADGIWVGDGDEVEVVGPGAREPIRDATLVEGDYRDGSTAFVFDGRPDDRVYVVLRRKAPTEAA